MFPSPLKATIKHSHSTICKRQGVCVCVTLCCTSAFTWTFFDSTIVLNISVFVCFIYPRISFRVGRVLTSEGKPFLSAHQIRWNFFFLDVETPPLIPPRWCFASRFSLPHRTHLWRSSRFSLLRRSFIHSEIIPAPKWQIHVKHIAVSLESSSDETKKKKGADSTF